MHAGDKNCAQTIYHIIAKFSEVIISIKQELMAEIPEHRNSFPRQQKQLKCEGVKFKKNSEEIINSSKCEDKLEVAREKK